MYSFLSDFACPMASSAISLPRTDTTTVHFTINTIPKRNILLRSGKVESAKYK